MTATAREGPLIRRAGVGLLLGLLAVTLSPACGARDGAANPTTPGPASTSTAPSTTRPRPVERFKGISDPVYSRGENWLCGPKAAKTDRCAVANQDTTVVQPDGRTEVRTSDPARDPRFDCFYVYPAFGFTGDADLAMAKDTTAEESLVFEEAARLREQCRVYAPLFRQSTTGSGAAQAAGDVRSAFRYYMSQWNGGRRIVLLGHGEGADHLVRLLQEEFDNDEELRGLLTTAFLIGGRVDTATGSRSGGTFRNIPTCAAPTDTGCVVGWSMSSSSTPRDVLVRWGDAPSGKTRLCVNPTSPTGGPGLISAIVSAEGQKQTPADVGTPFVELPDVLMAECVTSGGATTLVVRPADPPDSRNAGALLANTPGSGLHVAAVALAFGSIMEWISEQAVQLP